MTDNQKPNVEELYTTANNASNLRVVADRRGSADYLIAAAWASSRLGAAMIRLHTEWDSSAKPSKPTPAEINLLATTMPKAQAYKVASDWYATEVGNLVERLRSLREVREQVAIKAAHWRIEDPVGMAGLIIKYWLDQTCHHCAGLGHKVIANTPALSNKPCPACGGSGLGHVPGGNNGKRLANYMDECVEDAQRSIRRRLRSTLTP